ncbi:MAG: hypothetical protein OXQ30_04230 [Boseongicola sp.]|nr:hypothetical protein [Boseongicola sp.]
MSVFSVPEDSEALVLRGDAVKRKVGPGLQFKLPIFESAVIEPVLRVRQFRFDEPFQIQGCSATADLIYRIGDLEEFYAAGMSAEALEGKRADVEAALTTVPSLAEFSGSAEPFGTQIARHLNGLLGDTDNGIHITSINVQVEQDCEPKRVVVENQLDQLTNAGDDGLGSERGDPGVLRAVTQDRVELRIEGFVPTYNVADDAKARACFGNGTARIPPRIGALVDHAIRQVVQSLDFEEISQLPTRVHSAVASQDLSNCGLDLGAVDFSNTKLARRTLVNCADELADGCFDAPTLMPSLPRVRGD